LKDIKVGNTAISFWLITILVISGIGTAVGYYIWITLIIPVEVKEPIEILYYPSQFSFYAGETEEFNVTIRNLASVNYTVILDFKLDNAAYQDTYVTFRNKLYKVIPGQQNITAWIMVRPDAPAINASLTITFRRGLYPTGLVGYWRFDEGKGTIAYDSSGNDNHGILVNVSWVDGKYGKSLSFDGSSSYMHCGTLGNFGSTILGNVTTYTFWLKTSQTSFSRVMGTENAQPIRGASEALAIEINHPETDKLSIILKDNGGKWLKAYLTNPFDFTGTGWHHFVLIVDAKNTVLTFYIDGVSRDITYEYKASPSKLSNFEYPLVIGAFNWMGTPATFYEGLIDEVQIYNRALSSEEIQYLYEQGNI